MAIGQVVCGLDWQQPTYLQVIDQAKRGQDWGYPTGSETGSKRLAADWTKAEFEIRRNDKLKLIYTMLSFTYIFVILDYRT